MRQNLLCDLTNLGIRIDMPQSQESSSRKDDNEIKVFISHRDSKCDECGEELGRQAWITLEEGKGALCLACADLDELMFLPSGVAALTRPAKKYSTLSAVVLKFSSARGLYERQGLLVEEDAFAKAEEECLADSEVRELRKERERDAQNSMRNMFVSLPNRSEGYFQVVPQEGNNRLRDMRVKYSERVGRSAAAKVPAQNVLSHSPTLRDACIMPLMPTKSNRATAKKSNASRSRATKQRDPNETPLPPSADEYKLLVELTAMILDLEPWEFMNETDVFGVRDLLGQTGFVSVMGRLGEYKAIAIYQEAEGLYGWREFEQILEIEPESEEAHDLLYQIPHLQLSFGSNEFLDKHDREVIKGSGIKFPRDHKPLFRSYRPGYLPWYITELEARHLIQVLAQVFNVAVRFSEDENLIPVNVNPEDRNYLVVVPEPEGVDVSWVDSVQTIGPPPTQLTPFPLEESTVARLKELPKSGIHEIGFFMVPAVIGKRNERPKQLYVLMVSDAASYFVLGFQVLEVTAGIDLTYAELAENVATKWLEHEVVPVEVHVRSARLAGALEPLSDQLNVAIHMADEMPALDDAKEFLVQQMMAQ
jgi:hypothetical protein